MTAVILAEHTPVEVEVLDPACVYGEHPHENDEPCQREAVNLCRACMPAAVLDDADTWEFYLWPCVVRLAAERGAVARFGFDVRFEAVERRGFSVVLDHATGLVAAFNTALAARAAAYHMNRYTSEQVGWYRWAPDPSESRTA